MGWMVGPAGAIGLVVVVGSTVSVVAIAVPVVSEGCSAIGWYWYVEDCDMAGVVSPVEAAWTPVLFPLSFPFHLCMDWTLCVVSWGMVVLGCLSVGRCLGSRLGWLV